MEKVSEMHRLTAILIVSTCLLTFALAGPPLVYRTILPDTRPSSIAVGYDNGLAFVFDPVRGGISYVWTGSFLDLEPTWTGKLIQPAKVLGKVFFRDASELPFRKGDPKLEPEFIFKGYEVGPERVTFFYQVDGSAIEQTVTPLKTEREEGLHIRFKVADPNESYWLLLSPQPQARIICPEAKRVGKSLQFHGKETYSVVIQHD